MAIETAMKSSAFGFLLAKLHFQQYGARVPSAASVVWMALVGATLAVVWRFIPVTDGSSAAKPI
jgi:BASS family bile acid:Na+ symporter